MVGKLNTAYDKYTGYSDGFVQFYCVNLDNPEFKTVSRKYFIKFKDNH